jgi:toxin ParE1/3/4
MVKIVWTEYALADLKSIHDYIPLESNVYADRVIEKLIESVDQLITFPESGRIVPEFGQKTLKELIEGNYRIIYKIHPQFTSIVRVHHVASLLKNI